jgi:hypothetical protein
MILRTGGVFSQVIEGLFQLRPFRLEPEITAKKGVPEIVRLKQTHDPPVVTFRLAAPGGIKALGSPDLQTKELLHNPSVYGGRIAGAQDNLLKIRLSHILEDDPSAIQMVAVDFRERQSLAVEMLSDHDISEVLPTRHIILRGVGHDQKAGPGTGGSDAPEAAHGPFPWNRLQGDRLLPRSLFL